MVRLTTLAAVAVLAAGCGRGVGGDGRPLVVAGFFPLADVVREIGRAAVDVRDLTPAGAEAHDVELSPDDVDAVEDADVVVYAGGGFQPALEEAVERTEGTVVDALPGDARPGDPHFWLDPVHMRAVVADVADALAEAVPDAADEIRQRAQRYSATLDALHADFTTGLAGCSRRVIVTAHDAFGYLAARYDLEAIAVAGIDPEGEPGTGRIADLADVIRRRGVTTVFAEAKEADDVAAALARESGARVDVLYTLESEAPGADSYVDGMRSNLDALRRALGCG